MAGALVARLEDEIAPNRDAELSAALVSRVLLGFEKGQGQDLASVKRLTAEYVEAVEDYPLAAIRAAAIRFRKAKTLRPWNPTWRPSPGEFAAEVSAGLFERRRRLVLARRVRDVEAYEPPTPEQVAAVDAAMRDFVRTRRFPDGEAPRPTAVEIEAAQRSEALRLGAELVKAADPNQLSRLMGRLDAKRAPARASA